MMLEEVDIDISLVSRLIAAQFPQWAKLSVRPVEFSGWDNRTFHLGERMTVRLPSAAEYAEQVEKEHRWLPRFAPQLPLAIPVPLAMGFPGSGYPWHWSVYEWIPGENSTIEAIEDSKEFAKSLAGFLIALQAMETVEGPQPAQHNFFRGGSLSVYDEETRQAIEVLGDEIDSSAANEVWERALGTKWCNPPVWVHGDVSAGNLLVEDGRLSAVIDFGCSAVGDPACDLSIAWTLFAGDVRETFRETLPLDSGTWARGRAWTLWKALITACKEEGRSFARNESFRVLNEVLADHKTAG
jgi:aminoglycoside phosphotransferase (APT) family kinase protein